MKTIWKNNLKPFDKLNQNITCHTVVVGGGIAGLWCAYKLTKAGKKVIVLEAKRVGSGVTAGSSAIFTYAQDIIYTPLISKFNEKTAQTYLNDTRNAMNQISELIKTENWNCDFTPINFVLFSEKSKGAKELKKEKEAYQTLGVTVEETTTAELPYKVKKALLFPDAFQLDPLKLCSCLAKSITENGGQIFENTLVENAPNEDKTLTVGNYKVTAEHFIIATHFPYINFPGFYWLKMYQSQNYAIAFTAEGVLKNFVKDTSYESIDETGFEYRRAGNNVLCDGVSVRTGQKPYRSKYRVLENHLQTYFNAPTETARFMAQDCITLDHLPYAGLYSNFLNNVYVISGFNKWGMTNSYITSNVICNMVLGNLHSSAPFANNIYSPQRNSVFVSPIETISNLGTVAASFINNLLNTDAKKFERIKPGQGAIVRYKGKRIGASRDENGKLYLISGVCPHLGCNLKWNKDEFTFDCPCHGSRFTHTGEIINSPSVKPAERFK